MATTKSLFIAFITATAALLIVSCGDDEHKSNIDSDSLFEARTQYQHELDSVAKAGKAADTIKPQDTGSAATEDTELDTAIMMKTKRILDSIMKVNKK